MSFSSLIITHVLHIFYLHPRQFYTFLIITLSHVLNIFNQCPAVYYRSLNNTQPCPSTFSLKGYYIKY